MVTLLVARVGGWSAHRAAGVAARHVLRGSGSTASQVGYPAAIGRPIESVRRSYACAALAEKEASGEKKQKQKQQQKKGGGGGGNKGLTSRETDFSQWYQEVIAAADLVDQSPVKGCMVIKPYGMGLWESIREDLDRRIKKSGAQNAYFPLFIPVEFLSKEAEHVEGFAKECAVVTHHRLRSKEEGAGVEPDPEAELEEPLIVRPTSETMIWHMFQRWIMSYRDLPLKINQWANVVRWELRTRPFLRSAEFLWQEGHTAHATAEEADASAREMLDAYADLCADLLAMPVVKGMKSPTERFAGADETYTIEALMQNGWALQSGTSHFLGQNFAKAFDVYFTTKDNKNELVWATSYGASTRLIGGLVMTHSDDQGLVLPPNVAPTQVVLVPISPKGPEKAPEQHAELMEFDDDAVARLEAEGLRVKVDERWNMKPGPKFFEWEKKGVPLRIECGPRDVEARSLLCARRTGGDKFALTLDDSFGTTVAAELAAMQSQLLEAATERMKAATFEPATYGNGERARGLRRLVGAGLLPRAVARRRRRGGEGQEGDEGDDPLLPLDEQHRAEGQSCFMTGRPATHMALFARAF